MQSNVLLVIDGQDFTGFIKPGGYKWKRNDIDGEDAGRITMRAKMFRDRKAIKSELTIECRPLTGSETRRLLSAINPEYISVSFLHPEEGFLEDVEFYSNNVPASYLFRKPDGTSWWEGISFPLIER